MKKRTILVALCYLIVGAFAAARADAQATPRGVTQADVARVAQQYISPSSLAVVIVGDRKTIEQGLKAISVGPIAIRDIAGQPIQ